MVSQILSQFTPAAIIAAAIQGAIMALAVRLFIWAWGKKLPSEWAFFGAATVALFLIVFIASAVFGN
jgi:hypothetical protein